MHTSFHSLPLRLISNRLALRGLMVEVNAGSADAVPGKVRSIATPLYQRQ